MGSPEDKEKRRRRRSLNRYDRYKNNNKGKRFGQEEEFEEVRGPIGDWTWGMD